jgi:GTP-binding protein
MRKRRKQTPGIEKIGAALAFKTALSADVNWLVIHVSAPLGAQDKTLASELTSSNRGLIIVANKWDLITKKTTKTHSAVKAYLTANLNTLKWAHIYITSAKTNQGFRELIAKTKELAAKQQSFLEERELRSWWERFRKTHPATRPDNQKKRIRFYSFEQRGVMPLTFEVTVNEKDFLPPALVNTIERDLRKRFSLKGLPIAITFKRRRA